MSSFFYICREGFKFGIEGRNIISEYLDTILGLVVGSFQGKDATVKVLVVGVGHLGYKREILGQVGPHINGL
jgi:hypothetical protein